MNEDKLRVWAEDIRLAGKELSKAQKVQRRTRNNSRVHRAEVNLDALMSQYKGLTDMGRLMRARKRHLEKTLNTVMPLYSSLIHPGICQKTYTLLPRELRDIVYEHVAQFDYQVQMVSWPNFELLAKVQAYDGTTFLSYKLSIDDEVTFAHYFQREYVGAGLAREATELFYRKSMFKVYDTALDRFLAIDRWRAGIRPSDVLNNITIPFCNRRNPIPPFTEKDFERLSILRRLRNNNATITIEYSIVRPQHPRQPRTSRYTLQAEHARKEGRTWLSDSGDVVETLTAPVFTTLMPLLVELRTKGHTIAIVISRRRYM